MIDIIAPRMMFYSAIFLIILGLILISLFCIRIEKKKARELGYIENPPLNVNETSPKWILLFSGILVLTGGFIILGIMKSVGWL